MAEANWYNAGIKKDFIKHYTGTIGDYTFSTLFNKCAVMERDLEKDCSEFSLPEILDLARSFRSSDISSVRFKISLLNQYTQFCINSGMSKTGLCHYTEIRQDMYENLVDKRKMAQTYISRKEVEEIIDYFDNPRDKYLILAPFEGIYGKKLCEVINVKKKDLLGNNRVRLCTKREISVSSKLYDIMEDAADSYTAIYNGKEWALEKTDLVYKPVVIKSAEETSDIAIRRRFTRFKKYLDRDTFGTKMLYTSGFLNEIDKLVKKNGGFEEAKHAFFIVQEKYQSEYHLGTIRKMYADLKLIESF